MGELGLLSIFQDQLKIFAWSREGKWRVLVKQRRRLVPS
jgi:hypothetical protein